VFKRVEKDIITGLVDQSTELETGSGTQQSGGHCSVS